MRRRPARGVGNVTVEGVARRAGVNRATVYRRFGDRDALLEAAVLREGRIMARGIAAAVAEVEDPRERFVEGFVAAIRIAREHPILERVAKLEPETLIAGARANDSALLRFGAAFATAGLRSAGPASGEPPADPEQAGEIVARLFGVFVLFPATIAIDLRHDESVRTFVRQTLAPMVLGTEEDATG